jgi:uncharacterized integral membrane protein
MTSPPANENRPAAPPQPPAPSPGQLPAQHVVRRTRVGGVWVATALFAVVLLLLLIFILENGQRVDIGYFGAHGHLPLGVALLLAAVLGVLLVVIPGTGRIVQLRILSRRHRRIDADRAAAPPPAAAAAAASDGPPPAAEPGPPGQPARPSPAAEPGQPARPSPTAGPGQPGQPPTPPP